MSIKARVKSEAEARRVWRERRARAQKAAMSPRAREIERDLAVRNRENARCQLDLSED